MMVDMKSLTRLIAAFLTSLALLALPAMAVAHSPAPKHPGVTRHITSGHCSFTSGSPSYSYMGQGFYDANWTVAISCTGFYPSWSGYTNLQHWTGSSWVEVPTSRHHFSGQGGFAFMSYHVTVLTGTYRSTVFNVWAS